MLSVCRHIKPVRRDYLHAAASMQRRNEAPKRSVKYDKLIEKVPSVHYK